MRWCAGLLALGFAAALLFVVTVDGEGAAAEPQQKKGQKGAKKGDMKGKANPMAKGKGNPMAKGKGVPMMKGKGAPMKGKGTPMKGKKGKSLETVWSEADDGYWEEPVAWQGECTICSGRHGHR
jgi:hypothetical protein